MRTAFRAVLLLVTALLAGADRLPAQGLFLLPGVVELESDSIRDIAVAAVDLAEPVIYYNPTLASRYGPLLTRFFIAHEYGHIHHRHTRTGLVALSRAARDSALRHQELEADCFAARLDGPLAREATEAALRFFARLGPFRFDTEHPTGAQRAGQLLRCLPIGDVPLALRHGDTGVETGPVSGDVPRIHFAVRTAGLAGRAFGRETVLWLNGERVGMVSDLRFPQDLVVSRFGAGIHSYRLTVQLYDVAGMLGQSGTVTGRGQVLLQDGDRYLIEWEPGSLPQLVKEAS